MKNLIVLFIGLATALSTLNAQNETVTLNLDDFEGLGVSINADVVIREGRNQSVKVSGSQELIDDLDHTVKNGQWNIKFESDHRKSKKHDALIFEITVTSLKSLGISGIGSIRSEGSFSKVPKRTLAVSGIGSIKFEGDSDNLDIALSGSGHIDVESKSEYIHAAVSGSGDIDLRGEAKMINMAASGSGNIGSPDLSTDRCKAAISGTSILTAEVKEDLDVIVSGTGQFQYKGSPSIHKKSSSKNTVKRLR